MDWNGDGKRDANEELLTGVTVKLQSPGFDGVAGSADDLIATATTDANGQYCVTLPEGVYEMSVVTGLPPKFAALGKGTLKVQVKGVQISRAPKGAAVGPANASPSTPVDNLPFTGSQSGQQIAMALIVLAFGFGLFTVSRRRSRHARVN